MNRGPKSLWDDERIEKLRRLVAKKLSASKIAEALGAPSRNAVIGKCHRLGLALNAPAGPRRERRQPYERPAPIMRPPGRPPRTKPPPTPEQLVAEIGGEAAMEAVNVAYQPTAERMKAFLSGEPVEPAPVLDQAAIAREAMRKRRHPAPVNLAETTAGRLRGEPVTRRAGAKRRRRATTIDEDDLRHSGLLPAVVEPQATATGNSCPWPPVKGAGPAHEALRSTQCRWPTGEPSDETFHFCCAPTDPYLTPRYCEGHYPMGIAYRAGRN